MNQDPNMTWSPMGQGPEEDFGSILDFQDLQFDFSQFGTEGQDGVSIPHDMVEGNVVDSNMEPDSSMSTIKEKEMEQHVDPSLMPPHDVMAEFGELPGSTESLLELNMQAQMYHQQQAQQRHMHGHFQHGTVPPTPTSMEMTGRGQHYYRFADPQTQAMYQHYFPKPQDQTVFTPLVSPAVTPLENSYRMPEYNMTRDFSPLTSPALQAQTSKAPHHAHPAVRGSDTSDTMSPVETNVDMTAEQSKTKAPPLRKSKRKTTAAASKPPARSVQNSPAMKPLPKKKQSSVIPAKEVNDVLSSVQKAKAVSSSEADSVSPEPLSESLMPPPATPRSRSVAQSPYLSALANGSQSTPMLPISDSPATPASLMRIQKDAAELAKSGLTLSELKQQSSHAEAEMEQIIENMCSPAVVPASKPALPPINTAVHADKDATPTMKAKDRRLSSAPKSAPLTATNTGFPSLTTPKQAVIPKSRKRTSSSHVSPALRPRISPSIQPLLPEGTPHLSTSTTTALLASKSNYQNILEGTQVPGLTYPSTLATNLTSKRTSHKIAEQGRRNRINTALGEIAALLPAGLGGTTVEGGDGSGGTGGNNTNSKARTVEAAIEYIRMLKGEVKELKGKVEGLEKNVKAQSDEESKCQEGDLTGESPPSAEGADTNNAAEKVSTEVSTTLSQ